jgi:hypothetical protein
VARCLELGIEGRTMTLSAEQRQIIVGQTANMNPKERAIRANELIKRLRITDTADRNEVARLAAVRMEDVK